jgi:predicted nucleic acid-binding protein
VEGIERFRDKVIGLDTAPLIYLIEDHPVHAARLASFFQAARLNRVQLVTSVVTLTEVLVKPLRDGRDDLVRRYRSVLLSSVEVTTLSVNSEIAGRAAGLRAAHSLRTPDALQVATALTAGAAAFLTNDADFRKVPDLEILTWRTCSRNSETRSEGGDIHIQA